MENASILIAVNPSIPSVGEVAGMRFSVRIAGYEGYVSLPLNERRPQSNESFDSHDQWPSFAYHDGFPNPSTATASVRGSASIVSGPTQLNVGALHFEIEGVTGVSGSSWNASAFHASLQDWLRIFRSWIGQWTQLPQSETAQRIHGVTKFLFEENGVMVPHYFEGTLQTLFVGYELADESMFSTAIQAASSGFEVDEELQMLARAHLGLLRRDYRASIIDSCSAVEMSLIQWITKEFTHRYDAKTAKQLTKRLNGVAALFKIYFAAHGSKVTFEEVFEQLARPRNRALHNGEKFSEDDADRSFKMAKNLISETAQVLLPSDVLREISA